MSRYSDEDRERIRDAVDMVALVESRTELKRSGANSYFGRCPFHDERSPSFHVRPMEKHYHCFGCQASGDPFKFLMETEGLDFPSALESLAERFGVRIEPIEDDPAAVERRKRRERLLALLERTTAFYERVLWDSGEATQAREMLQRRGLSKETLQRYRVGYSPSAWDRVLLASRESGFSEEELIAAGLAQRARGKDGIFDRFRGRIMFPLADQRGRVLGFGARSMRDGQGPKYLNSAEGEVYHKGSQLFGLDVARSEAAKTGSVVLVEGYVDSLALYEAGVANNVALMGTALTDEQAAQLERSAHTLLLALDADRAGVEAMIRAGRIASGRKLELRVVVMPAGKDPGDLLVEEGGDRLRSRVSASEPFLAFHTRTVVERGDLSSAEGKDAILADLGAVLGAQPASVLKEELIAEVAAKLGIAAEMASGVIAMHASKPDSVPAASPVASAPRSSRAPSIAGPADRVARVERAFLSLCLAIPVEGSQMLDGIDVDRSFNGELEKAAALHIRDHVDDPLSGLALGSDDPLATLVSELISLSAGLHVSKAALRLECAQLEKLRLDREIETAKREDPGAASQLALEREGVRATIHAAAEEVEQEGELLDRQEGRPV